MRRVILTDCRCLLSIAAVVLIGTTRLATADSRSTAVVVALRPTARTEAAIVRIADVADLSGGTAALRNRIAALDLDDAPEPGTVLEIDPAQIEFRLRLARIEPRDFMIRGDVVHVVSRYAATSRVATATQPSRVPAQPVSLQKDKPASSPPPAVRTGSPASTPRVIEPFAVKRRDRVKAIARIGDSTVSVTAEAQQDGRVGDVIKVKNIDSNATIYGRVLSSTELEVTP